MGQKLRMNKREQWNKHGQWISLGKNINVDNGEMYLAFTFYSPECLVLLWGAIFTYYHPFYGY